MCLMFARRAERDMGANSALHIEFRDKAAVWAERIRELESKSLAKSLIESGQEKAA
jgi:hypothetical protein